MENRAHTKVHNHGISVHQEKIPKIPKINKIPKNTLLERGNWKRDHIQISKAGQESG